MKTANTAKISLYTESEEVSASSYYRLFQYLDGSGYTIRKRAKLPNKYYGKWKPITAKPLYFKVYAFAYQYFRRFSHLLRDCISAPDVMILSRGLITRVMPLSYRVMLSHMMKRGVKLIWDYDDNIIEVKEISRKYFDWMSSLASHIVVAGEANVDMLRDEYRSKAVILPTTDGDMYKSYDEEMIRRRVEQLDREIRLIWVGTSISLPYLEAICPVIEKFASDQSAKGRNVSFTVVCNHPLEYRPENFRLNNVKWTRAVAMEEMKKAHFGLMPLSGKSFNRYKGGFKLIQYLSVGIPVVGSAIGINEEIIQPGFGFKPHDLNHDEWLEALNNLPVTPREYTEFSKNAFRQWTKNYSYESNRDKWLELVAGVLR